MEAESVTLLVLKMLIYLVCTRDFGVGGLWRDRLRGFFCCRFVVLVVCFSFVFPLFIWLSGHVGTWRVIAPHFFMS